MDFFNTLNAGGPQEWRSAVLSLLAAFAMAHVVAAAYVWSHRGLSYSRSFIETIVMSGLAAAMMMMAIGSNLVWGIGMVGALSLGTRFRANLTDPRDMIFILVAMISGIAAGTGAFLIGAAGVAAFLLTTLYLRHAAIGLQNGFDALLRFTVPASETVRQVVDECLAQHCSSSVLTLLQEVAQGDATEQVYQLRFRKPQSRDRLVRQLEQVPGLANLSLMLEESRSGM